MKKLVAFTRWVEWPPFLLECIMFKIFDWPKCSFGLFDKMIQKTPNELFGQPNIPYLLNGYFGGIYEKLTTNMCARNQR